MSAFVLRPARPLDAGAVGAILSGFAARTRWMPKLYSEAETISFAGTMIARGWVTVAVCDAGVAGFLARAGREVHALYVAEGMARRGVGAALLLRAQAEAPALRLWTFAVNAPAQAFYAAHGFVEVARSDGARNEERLPDIEMRWAREAV